jgi:hypothetical protein
METSREETQVPEPSALPDVIRCAEHECGASVANYSRNADTDEVTVRNLRRSGWGVVAGQWACRDHGAEDSYPRNVFCGRCGTTHGGAYGHNSAECLWNGDARGRPCRT